MKERKKEKEKNRRMEGREGGRKVYTFMDKNLKMRLRT